MLIIYQPLVSHVVQHSFCESLGRYARTVMERQANTTYAFLMSHMEKAVGQIPVTVMISSFNFDSSGERIPKSSESIRDVRPQCRTCMHRKLCFHGDPKFNMKFEPHEGGRINSADFPHRGC